MKEEIRKHPLNVTGRYYVDCDTCLDHELCVETAPNNFRMDYEMLTAAYVFKQPDNPEEEAQCRQALEECPVTAILDDGEA
jgi:ferredoxin